MSASRSIGEANLAAVGAVLAEPARARVLLALADGRSLAASVLAREAGVAPSTASHHLARLVDAGFIRVVCRGRHRYFSLAGPRIGELIEAAARVAPVLPITSLRQGTRAHAVRYARRCYDHLAGRVGVALTDAFCEQELLVRSGSDAAFTVTPLGVERFAGFGVASSAGDVVRGCLDWTEQRPHIAGPLGRAVLGRLLELDWLSRDPRSRAVRLTDSGREQLPLHFGVELPAA